LSNNSPITFAAFSLNANADPLEDPDQEPLVVDGSVSFVPTPPLEVLTAGVETLNVEDNL
jgi:hypothetical protein